MGDQPKNESFGCYDSHGAYSCPSCKLWDYIEEQSTIAPPRGWLPTGTCQRMTVTCKCGHVADIDARNSDFYQCLKCQRVFAINQYVQLVELPKELEEVALREYCVATDKEKE